MQVAHASCGLAGEKKYRRQIGPALAWCTLAPIMEPVPDGDCK